MTISCKQSFSSHSTGLFPHSNLEQHLHCCSLACWNLSLNWHIQTCSLVKNSGNCLRMTSKCKCCYSLLSSGSWCCSGLKTHLLAWDKHIGPSHPLARPAAALPPETELWVHLSFSQEAPVNPFEHNFIFRWLYLDTENNPLSCSVAFE